MRALAIPVLCALAWAPGLTAAERQSHWRAIWHLSEALLASADAADAATSWAKPESNPLIHSGPRFSYGSLTIKIAALGGGIVAQHYVVRRMPAKSTLFAITNLAGVGLFSAAAVHNTHVPRAPD